MRIANIMCSRVLGGVEQAFLNYNKALAIENNEVYAFYNTFGKIKSKLEVNKNIIYLPSLFFKPYFLMFPYYYFKIKKLKIDVIIVQSKKILPLFSKIGKILKIPVIIVAHNEKTKLLNKADYIFSITKYQKNIFIKNGFDKDKIFVIPNLIDFKKDFKELKNFNDPVTFGVIGRFDPMKGFKTFVNACKILKENDVKFRAVIGGAPQKQYINEYNEILSSIKENNLTDNFELLGWVKNKDNFYNKIDIFVLPSNYEPFGIVLLEAMMYSKPIISSLAEGPKEILNNKNVALMFNANDYNELAHLMQELINNQKLAKSIAEMSYKLVNTEYTIEKVASDLNSIIKLFVE